MKRLVLVALVVAASLSAPQAQSPNFAVAALIQGNIFEGWSGPFRARADGTDILFVVLCVNGQTRNKFPMEVAAFIPDGTNAAGLLTRSTTTLVNACASAGVPVNRGAVLLPAMQFGQ